MKEALKKSLNSRGVKQTEVGFFDSARYPDGTSVPAVAVWNEFGSKNTPERSFFRNALDSSKPKVLRMLKHGVDPYALVVSSNLANQIGAVVAGEIQESIVELKEPPNAESTIRAKKSSNPLIEKSFMLQSATWKVEA